MAKSTTLDRQYYIVNTDAHYPPSHNYMLASHRAAAFFDRKDKIDCIKKNDIVFLYHTGVGVVAAGEASGRIDIKPFSDGDTHEADGEHSTRLLRFRFIDPPITARTISAISKNADGIAVILRGTLVHLRPKTGRNLYATISERAQIDDTPELSAIEGRAYKAEAMFRERNYSLIEAKKALSNGKCEVCGFSFGDQYVGLSRDCLTAHHGKPIGRRKAGSRTRLNDIHLLCPNCHAAVHTEDPPIPPAELRRRLRR